MFRDDATESTLRIRNSAYFLLCVCQVAAVSWALLTPDPFAIVRDTSLDWVCSVSDLLLHASVFTVLSATVFSYCLVARGEFPTAALFGLLAYSITVEGLQAFVPGRTCDSRDAIANVVGFVLGLTLVRIFSLFRAIPARAQHLASVQNTVW